MSINDQFMSSLTDSCHASKAFHTHLSCGVKCDTQQTFNHWWNWWIFQSVFHCYRTHTHTQPITFLRINFCTFKAKISFSFSKKITKKLFVCVIIGILHWLKSMFVSFCVSAIITDIRYRLDEVTGASLEGVEFQDCQ